MEVIRTAAGLRAETDFRRAVEQRVGLVPTMGAFHEGHAALIARARAETSFVVVSIFVNPAQFGPGEDFAAYPRDEDGDLAACERLGVDLVWLPPLEEVYPTGVDLPSPDPGAIGSILEGVARPTHFRGVLRVVHRLFSVTGPCAAYFGEKDAQQLFLVRRMVKELQLPVDVRPCPTVRAPDGVAQSSRNVVPVAPGARAGRLSVPGALRGGRAGAWRRARCGDARRGHGARDRRHAARAARLRNGGRRGDVRAHRAAERSGPGPGRGSVSERPAHRQPPSARTGMRR